MKNKIIVVSLLVLVAIFAFSGLILAQSNVLYWGSSGDDVRTVQNRLKSWGYYDGPVDGDYGTSTSKAVKAFQSKNGIDPDGVVGDLTREALGLPVTTRTGAPATTPAPSRGDTSRDDVTLLAHLVMGEAGSEPYLGKVAVAAVILNRVESDKFPNTLAGVIYQPNAFESITNGIANSAPSSDCMKAAQDALGGWDPTQGCLFFWNPSKPVSSWIWSRPIVTQIGDHVFAK